MIIIIIIIFYILLVKNYNYHVKIFLNDFTVNEYIKCS